MISQLSPTKKRETKMKGGIEKPLFGFNLGHACAFWGRDLFLGRVWLGQSLVSVFVFFGHYLGNASAEFPTKNRHFPTMIP